MMKKWLFMIYADPNTSSFENKILEGAGIIRKLEFILFLAFLNYPQQA